MNRFIIVSRNPLALIDIGLVGLAIVGEIAAGPSPAYRLRSYDDRGRRRFASKSGHLTELQPDAMASRRELERQSGLEPCPQQQIRPVRQKAIELVVLLRAGLAGARESGHHRIAIDEPLAQAQLLP